MARIGRAVQQQVIRGIPIVETGGVGAISPGVRSAAAKQHFGNVTNPQAVATQFTPTANVTAISLSVSLNKNASPTDDALVTLQTDAAGVPSGTILATLDVPAASIPATAAGAVFSATFSADLVAGTPYWIVFSRSGTLDNTNYFTADKALGDSPSPTYPTSTLVSGVWGAVALPPINFSLLTAGDTLAGYAPNIGPQPPLVISPAASAAVAPFAPISVNLATGVLTNQRRAQQRFPFQGWDETMVFTVQPPSAPILDRFHYAGQPTGLDGSGDWNGTPIGPFSGLRVGTNFTDTVSPSGATCGSFTTTTYGPDVEAYYDIVQKDTTNPTFVARVQVRIHNPTVASSAGRTGYEIQVAGNGSWQIVVATGSGTTTLLSFTQPIANGDKIGIQCIGNTINAWWFDGSGGGWQLVGSVIDSTVTGAGNLGITLQGGASTLWSVDNFAGGTITSAPLAAVLVGRRLGPRPPVLLFVSAPTQASLTAFQSVAARVARQQRAPHSDLFGFIPQVSAQPPPPIQVNLATGLLTNQRRPSQRRTEHFLRAPTVLQTFSGPKVTLIRTRPRGTEVARRGLIFYAQSGVISVNLATGYLTNQRRPSQRRTEHFLRPPTVLQTFAGPGVTLVAVRTRVERQRRRLPDSFLLPPATLEPEAVQIAERQIRVALVRTRPRHTVGTRLSYTVYPQTSDITVTTVRTRPRPTSRHLAPPATLVSRAFSGPQVSLVRTKVRPRDNVGAWPIFESGSPLSPAFLDTFSGSSYTGNWTLTAGDGLNLSVSGGRLIYTWGVGGTPDTIQTINKVWFGPGSTLQIDIPTAPGDDEFSFIHLSNQIGVGWSRQNAQTLDVYGFATNLSINIGATSTSGQPTNLRLRWINDGTPLGSYSWDYSLDNGATWIVAHQEAALAGGFGYERLQLDFFAGLGAPGVHGLSLDNARLDSPQQLVAPRPMLGPWPPLLITVTAPQDKIVTSDTTLAARRHPSRRTHSLLSPPVSAAAAAQTFGAPIASFVRTRPRHVLGTKLSPPTTLQVFTGPKTPLVKTRPRPTLSISQRGLIFYAQTSEIAVTLVHTRPRPTTRFLKPAAAPQVAVAYYGPQVVVTHVRPRKTIHTLGPLIFYAQTSTISVKSVRTRPRKTVWFLAPPSTLEPESVALVEREIRVLLVHTRPRPTTKRLTPPTVIRVPSVEQREDTITVALVKTRPRPTTRRLKPPTVLQVFGPPVESEIAIRTPVEDRRRAPHSRLFPPTVIRVPSVEQAEDTIRVVLVRTRPRHTVEFPIVPSTLEAESIALVEREIRTTLVHTRPRHTLGTDLGPLIFYAQTSEISVTIVHTRPRPTTRFLSEPTVLQTFFGPDVTLVHTRPRPTIKTLGEPTVVRVPSVEQLEDTIQIHVVHTRPRPTTRVLFPPLVKTFPPVVTTFLPTHLVQTRPRPTRKFLRPPTVIIPLPTQRMQTITVTLVRIKPRPTRRTLGPLIFYRQTSEIQVTLARTRPRQTHSFLHPPFFYKATSEIQVTLVKTRPRPTTKELSPPTVLRVFTAPFEIQVTLVRTRPRPTTKELSAPTVLRTFTGPEISLVHTRPRATRYFLRPPTVVRVPSVEQVEQTVRVTLTHTRPRQTRRFVAPPTVVRGFIAAPVLVFTTRTRPRPQAAKIKPPTRLSPPETTVHVHLVVTRPRPTRHLIVPPVVIRPKPPLQPPVTITLAGRTRSEDIRRAPHSRLNPPPRILHIPLYIRIEEPPSGNWRLYTMTSGWIEDSLGTDIQVGTPQAEWDTEPPDENMTTGKLE